MPKFFNFKFLFIFFTVIFLIPIWSYEFLPFVDYPQHLGMAHILQKLPDTALPYNEHFGVNFFPATHILDVLLIYLFSFFVPLEIAGRIFISLYIILLPLSIFCLIRALNGNRYFSLLAFLFIYNYSLMWGFIVYCLGISLFFVTLSFILRYVYDEEKKLAPLLTFLFIGAFLTHAQIYLFLLVAYLAVLICTYKSQLFKILKKGLVVLPSFVFLIPWTIDMIAAIGKEAMRDIHKFSPLWKRSLNLRDFLAPGIPLDDLVLAVFALLFIFIVIGGRKAIKPFIITDKKIFIIYSLASFSAFCYFVLPRVFAGYFLIYQRFAIFIPLFLIGLMSRVKIKKGTVFILITLALVFATFAGLMVTFYRFNQYATPVNTLLAKTEESKKMVELYYGGSFKSPVRYHAFLHFACYYMVRKNGLAGYLFSRLEWLPVRIKKDYLKHRISSWKASKSIFPSGWEQFDYFLVCGSPPAEEKKYYKNLKMVEKIGVWTLYEKGS